MSRLIKAAGLFLALAGIARSTPDPEAENNAEYHRLEGRRLLGSSFGVPNLNATFDYVVVGAGIGGLTIANRLSEDPSVRVAVVEGGGFYEIEAGNISQIPLFDNYWAGKDPNDTNPLVDWDFVTTPQAGANGDIIHYPRGKTLGGSSARNYMVYQRSTIGAYQQWAEAVGDDSYTFENWLPYFEKSLNFTGPDMTKRFANSTPEYDTSLLGNGEGPLHVTFSNYAQAFATWIQKGFEQIGIKPRQGFTSGALFGSSYCISTINRDTGVRESSETAFLTPYLDRENLVVYVHSTATKIMMEGNTAVGVELDSGYGIYNLTAKKEVIVSGGALQSPQLLMVSGIGPAATLQGLGIPVIADRPGVGQNMWDHILFGPSYRVNVITGSSTSNPEFMKQAEEDFNTDASGMLGNSGGDFLAWEKVPEELRANWTSEVKSSLAEFPADWPELEYISTPGYDGYGHNYAIDIPKDDYQYATAILGLVAPLSRGNVTINTTSAIDPPIINPNWLTDPADAAVAVAGYRRARQLFATPAMKEIEIGPEYFPGAQVQTDEEILELIRQSFNTIYHTSCTCKMGKSSDPMAVIDTQARVMGANNLRVVDASSFPFLPAGHPVSTIYALAEKIADDIKTGSSVSGNTTNGTTQRRSYTGPRRASLY